MKTLIFDLDGTLADSVELLIDVAHDVLDRPRASAEDLARLRKLPPLKIVRELHIPLWQVPKLVAQARRKMHARMHEVHPVGGMPEALQALHKQGHRMLIMSTNSEQNIRAFLRAYKLEPYFDGVYSGIGLFDKARALRKVIRRNKIDRAMCFYVGDEVRDIAAAKKVGVHGIAVGWGYQDPETLARYQPFALLHKPAELQTLFKPAEV
jgi:phosphoglycolate phosphatase